MRYLPDYNPTWSDGCTIAPLIPEKQRKRFQMWMVNAINSEDVAISLHLACVAHDHAYYYGGSVEDRLAADKLFLEQMKEAGAPFWFRHAAYRAVRMWGGPSWRQKGVSWSYGGSYFKYGLPAIPVCEIRAPGAVQRIKPTLELLSADAWPFQEPRCECPNFTFLFPWEDDFDKGVICGGCGKEFKYNRSES